MACLRPVSATLLLSHRSGPPVKLARRLSLAARGYRPACSAARRSRLSSAAPPSRTIFLRRSGESRAGGATAASGEWHPWPWTINAEGQGAFFESKAEAIAAVRALQARGVRSIDIGCMQVNLMHHPDAFATLEQAFDPRANVAYAARFLTSLFGQAGTWPRAAALYHSATPELGAEYQRRMLAVWPDESKHQREASRFAGLRPGCGRSAARARRLARWPAPSSRVALGDAVEPEPRLPHRPDHSDGRRRSELPADRRVVSNGPGTAGLWRLPSAARRQHTRPFRGGRLRGEVATAWRDPSCHVEAFHGSSARSGSRLLVRRRANRRWAMRLH